LASEFGSTTKPVRHWGTAAVFATIAALPPIILLAIEGGAASRAWALLSGDKISYKSPVVFGLSSDTIAWAWAIFFVVLALIYATDTGPEGSGMGEPGAFGDYLPPEPEPESEVRVAMTSGPPVEGGDSLPAVPNVPEAMTWFKKGGELFAQGRYEEAISHFDKALKLHPRLAGAWAGRGLACNAMRQYNEAIRCYDESLRLDPQDAAVWHDKGNVLCAIGRLESALNCFNEALVIDPRDARAWNNKGICLASLGRPEEALPCCTKAIQLDPSYAVAWQAKAMIEERLVRIQDAVASYKRFIALASAGDAAAVERVQRHVSVLEAGPLAGT
jgi:Flp pilus assembly protein TadD